MTCFEYTGQQVNNAVGGRRTVDIDCRGRAGGGEREENYREGMMRFNMKHGKKSPPPNPAGHKGIEWKSNVGMKRIGVGRESGTSRRPGTERVRFFCDWWRAVRRQSRGGSDAACGVSVPATDPDDCGYVVRGEMTTGAAQGRTTAREFSGSRVEMGEVAWVCGGGKGGRATAQSPTGGCGPSARGGGRLVPC